MPHTWHFLTPGPSLMSVPRPAMFVAIVMEPGWPACATISASRSWYLAFSTSCFRPLRFSMRDSVSETSTLTVPISTGNPFLCCRSASSMTALYFSRRVL